jgi:hypothetical protein
MANINNLNKDLFQIYNKSPFTVETILKYNLVNFPFNAVDNNNNTLLHNVVKNNDVSTLVAFLNYVSLNGYKNLLNMQNSNGDTALHIAVRNKNEQIAKMLDNAGINKSIRNKNGEYIASDSNPSDDQSINLSDLNDTESRVRCHKQDGYHKKITKKPDVEFENASSESARFFEELTKELEKLRTFSVASPRRFIMNGGGNDTSTIEINLVDINNNQLGGARKQKKQKRSTSSESSTMSKRSRDSPKESSTIHENIVKKFVELGYPDDDAKAMKAGLYSLVKEKHSELSNLEKAKKMLEYLEDKTIINTLKKKIDELRDIIQKARELKQNQKTNAEIKEPKAKSKAKPKSKSKEKTEK